MSVNSRSGSQVRGRDSEQRSLESWMTFSLLVSLFVRGVSDVCLRLRAAPRWYKALMRRGGMNESKRGIRGITRYEGGERQVA